MSILPVLISHLNCGISPQQAPREPRYDGSGKKSDYIRTYNCRRIRMLEPDFGHPRLIFLKRYAHLVAPN